MFATDGLFIDKGRHISLNVGGNFADKRVSWVYINVCIAKRKRSIYRPNLLRLDRYVRHVVSLPYLSILCLCPKQRRFQKNNTQKMYNNVTTTHEVKKLIVVVRTIKKFNRIGKS